MSTDDFSLYEWATEGWEGVDEDDRREAAKVLREIDDEEDFQDVDGLDVVTY